MKVTDPVRYFGIDSGMRRVTLSAAEAGILRRAAVIADRAHDLATDALGNGHYDLGDVNLCELGPSLRLLADGEVQW